MPFLKLPALPVWVALVGSLLVPCRESKAQGEVTWSLLYKSPPRSLVDQVYLVDREPLTVLVLGDGGEIRACGPDKEDSDPKQDFLPPAGKKSRYFVSANGASIGRADLTQSGESRSVTFKLFRDQDPLSSFELPGPVTFLVSDDGRSVIALQPDTSPEHASRATVFDDTGRVRKVNWSIDPQHGPIHAVQFSGDGQKLGVRQMKGLFVYDCTADASAKPDSVLRAAPAFRLSFTGERIATRERRSVTFWKGSKSFHTVETEGAPLDAVFSGDRYAAVVEESKLHWIDLDADPPRELTHRAKDGWRYRSVAVVSIPDPPMTRIAVGMRREDSDRFQGAMELHTFRPGQERAVRTSTTFPFEVAHGRSPEVRFVQKGEQVVIWTRDKVLLSSALTPAR